MERLSLIPCYEGTLDPATLSNFHALHGRLDEAGMMAFLRAVCDYCDPREDVSTPEEAASFLTALPAQASRILAGGLTARKGDFEIEPACCCGLEAWREWHDLFEHQVSPWLGHDPTAWVEPKDGQFILHTDQGEKGEALAVSPDELAAALNQARVDLEAFFDSLRTWMIRDGVAGGIAMCERLETWFCVGEQQGTKPVRPGDGKSD